MVADSHGRKSHSIVVDALTALANLEHRGAAGAEPTSGDGAGILVQVPDALLRAEVDFALPEPDADGSLGYAVGLAFLPVEDDQRAKAVELVERIAAEEQLRVLGWRDVVVHPDEADVGPSAQSCMPRFAQLFVAAATASTSSAGETRNTSVTGIALDRLAFCLRKRAERDTAALGCGTYFASLSSRTLVYKGMLTTHQLPAFFADLTDERLESAIALVHSRFSTNTFPSWPLAHPFRYVAHNGEINTIRGNRNRMRAREALLGSDLIRATWTGCTRSVPRARPTPPLSTSAGVAAPRRTRPAPRGADDDPGGVENHTEMDPARKAFYKFHASLMEAWDGPACVTFTDGTLVGAVLDRNGLRPARWWQLADGRVVLSSESGVLDVPPGQVVAKGRLRPGRMFLVDTAAGRIVATTRSSPHWPRSCPTTSGCTPGCSSCPACRPASTSCRPTSRCCAASSPSATPRRAAHPARPDGHLGRRADRLDGHGHPGGRAVPAAPAALRLLRPAVRAGHQPAAGRDPGGDRHLRGPGDGPGAELLQPKAASCRHLRLNYPVIDNDELAKILHVNDDGNLPGFAAAVISGLYEVDGGDPALSTALDRVRREASEAIAEGPGSWCCPTGTPTTGWRRSRR